MLRNGGHARGRYGILHGKNGVPSRGLRGADRGGPELHRIFSVGYRTFILQSAYGAGNRHGSRDLQQQGRAWPRRTSVPVRAGAKARRPAGRRHPASCCPRHAHAVPCRRAKSPALPDRRADNVRPEHRQWARQAHRPRQPRPAAGPPRACEKAALTLSSSSTSAAASHCPYGRGRRSPVRACWGGGATRRASGEAGVRKCPSASRQPRRSSRASRER